MAYHKENSRLKTQNSKLRLLAPAKINIGLVVKGRLPSGYHKIETILVPIKLYDVLTLKKCPEGIDCRCQILKSKDNLVVKSAQLFFDTTKISGGVKIFLKKRIPIGAGLGGGSSDAAYTLLGLNYLYGNILNLKQLHSLAIKIGMDVPFFLYQKPCYATGRGEILKPIKLPKLSVALYIPRYHISTKWAYQRIQDSRFKIQYSKHNVGLTDRDFSIKILMKRLIDNKLSGINWLVGNTFESIVFTKHPDLLKVKSLFLANGAYVASLSGTGSTVFGIFDKRRITKIRNKLGFKVLLTETLSG